MDPAALWPLALSRVVSHVVSRAPRLPVRGRVGGMSYDVHALRACFPALAEGAAHFDGPGGSQVPASVAAAVAAAMTSAMANRGRHSRAERRADAVVESARAAAADLVGADPRGVVFGRSMTALAFDLARTLARRWAPGDEVVVTDLDHEANIGPWAQGAARAGATVRTAHFDPATGELEVAAVEAVIGPATKLVALTGASNLIGTRPDVAAVAAAAHRAGAVVVVDGVHLSAHAPVDLAASGADFWLCSPYKWLGPHCGILAADPSRLETLRPDKLDPSPDRVPERFELGTLPYELLAGVSAAVDFIAGLADLVGSAAAPPPGADRRARVRASMAAVEAHEVSLLAGLEGHLAGLEGLTCYSRAARRTPTLLLEVAGRHPDEVAATLAARGVNAPAGSFYAPAASRRLGLGDHGGVRVGLAPYTSTGDIDRLVEGLAAVTGGWAA